MMGNIASGGPRFVVAGRDRARPSKGYLLGIPIFHHSIIPLKLLIRLFQLPGGALVNKHEKMNINYKLKRG